MLLFYFDIKENTPIIDLCQFSVFVFVVFKVFRVIRVIKVFKDLKVLGS